MKNIFRKIYCVLIKNIWFLKALKKYYLRKKRTTHYKKYVEPIKSLERYEKISDTKIFLMNFCESFIPLATAHYNFQLDYISSSNYKYYAKTDFDSMLDLAENYFLRNRSRVFEWWCLYGDGQKNFLSEEEKMKLDLGISFNEVFAEKMINQQPSIEVHPDSKTYGTTLAINDSNEPNIFFMNVIKLRAKNCFL